MTTALQQFSRDATTANSALATASLSADSGAIKAASEALATAELALAKARASEFANLQASSNKLNPAQVTALAATGGAFNAGRGGAGRGGGGGNNGPTPLVPLNFNDHEGYV